MPADLRRNGTDRIAETIETALAPRRAGVHGRPFVLGLCGAQGSGKSTLAAVLGARMEADGIRAATLSLDDLYLPRPERLALARSVHPLLATRGVPGTHDPTLGLRLLDGLAGCAPVAVPRFDKALDTRVAEAEWQMVAPPVDVVIFEGWCVGARQQAAECLDMPVNALERSRDADGRWRRWVNDQLAGSYQALFARIDMLVLLQAPGMDVVAGWRNQQEQELRARLLQAGRDTAATLDEAQISLFVQHYQRLTEYILTEMPDRADLVIRLDAQRRLARPRGSAPWSPARDRGPWTL